MFLKRKSSLILKVTLFLSLFYGCERLSHKYMHGFSYQNFTITPPQNFKINHTFSNDITPLLQQPFSFLGYGGESLVFTSDDQKWVLKVFKKHRLYPYFQLGFIKYPPFLIKALHSRQQLYFRFWDSLKLQIEQCLDESGIIYIHLPYKSLQIPPVTLIDPCGSKHTMDLGSICFIIQKKGELFEDVYLHTNDPLKKKAMLESLLSFYTLLKSKNLYIWDNAIYRNIGWLEGKPFLIDAGSIRKNPSELDILKNVNDLKTWVKKNDKNSYSTLLELIATHESSDAL